MAFQNGWRGPDIVSDGLVLYLDAGSPNSYRPDFGTTWKDMSGFNNSGSLINGPTYSSANGGSIVFDGVDDYVTTNLITIGTNNTTNIIWYKWNGIDQIKILSYLGSSGINGMGYIINNGSGAPIGNKVSVLYGGAYYNAIDTGTLFGTLVSNVYTQLTLTRDTTTTRLYQNGVFLGSTTKTPNANTSNLTFSLGDALYIAAGSVAITMFYNKALSATEVLQNYNATKTRFGL
jgi:hypothetical protein